MFEDFIEEQNITLRMIFNKAYEIGKKYRNTLIDKFFVFLFFTIFVK